MNRIFNKKVIIILVLLAVTFFYYFLVTGSTFQIATIEKKIIHKDKNLIVVRSVSTITEIEVPDIVWPFLEVGEEYSMKFRFNSLRPPYLTYIKPTQNED